MTNSACRNPASPFRFSSVAIRWAVSSFFDFVSFVYDLAFMTRETSRATGTPIATTAMMKPETTCTATWLPSSQITASSISNTLSSAVILRQMKDANEMMQTVG